MSGRRMIYGAPPPRGRVTTRAKVSGDWADQALSERLRKHELERQAEVCDSRTRAFLASARKASGLGLRHVAREIGVSASTLSDWEKGNRRPSDEHLKTLVEFYRALPY